MNKVKSAEEHLVKTYRIVENDEEMFAEPFTAFTRLERKRDNERFVLKKMKILDLSNVTMLETELDIMKKLPNTRYLVHVYDYYKIKEADGHYFYLILEHFERTLEEFIVELESPLEYVRVVEMMSAMMRNLKYLM